MASHGHYVALSSTWSIDGSSADQKSYVVQHWKFMTIIKITVRHWTLYTAEPLHTLSVHLTRAYFNKSYIHQNGRYGIYSLCCPVSSLYFLFPHACQTTDNWSLYYFKIINFASIQLSNCSHSYTVSCVLYKMPRHWFTFGLQFYYYVYGSTAWVLALDQNILL